MIENPLISVIIPAYNAEKYIKQAICSILKQRYSNLEILIVNDGSTDSTLQICQDLQKKDERIIVFQGDHKGVSKARNIALERAKGSYVCFVDADDYIEPRFISELYTAIKDNDMSACGYVRFRNEEKKRLEVLHQEYLWNREEVCERVLCDNHVGGYLCTKMFRMDIIRKNELRMDTCLSIGEDMLFIAEYIKHIEIAKYINIPLYCYRINEDSALQETYFRKKFQEKKLDNLDAAEKIAKTLESQSAAIDRAVAYRYVRTVMWTMINILSCHYYDRSLLKRMQEMIKGRTYIYCRSKYSKKLEKMCAVAIRCMPVLFWKCADLGLRIMPERLTEGYFN